MKMSQGKKLDGTMDPMGGRMEDESKQEKLEAYYV
jgi:hypothetical protein